MNQPYAFLFLCQKKRICRRGTPDSEHSQNSILNEAAENQENDLPEDIEATQRSRESTAPPPPSNPSVRKITPRYNLNSLSGPKASGSGAATPSWVEDFCNAKEQGMLLYHIMYKLQKLIYTSALKLHRKF